VFTSKVAKSSKAFEDNGFQGNSTQNGGVCKDTDHTGRTGSYENNGQPWKSKWKGVGFQLNIVPAVTKELNIQNLYFYWQVIW